MAFISETIPDKVSITSATYQAENAHAIASQRGLNTTRVNKSCPKQIYLQSVDRVRDIKGSLNERINIADWHPGEGIYYLPFKSGSVEWLNEVGLLFVPAVLL